MPNVQSRQPERDTFVRALGETWLFYGVATDDFGAAIGAESVRLKVGESLTFIADLDNITGAWTITIPPSAQMGVAAGLYPMEVRAVLETGEVATLHKGRLLVNSMIP